MLYLTDSSLLDQLNNISRAYGQPNTTLCDAVNWARDIVDGMVERVSL